MTPEELLDYTEQIFGFHKLFLPLLAFLKLCYEIRLTNIIKTNFQPHQEDMSGFWHLYYLEAFLLNQAAKGH